MSDEDRNVEMLKRAYSRWSETKGASVDEWLNVCDEKISIGSLAQGRPVEANYLANYNSRDALKDYFAGLARDWDMLRWDTKHFIARGDRVVVLVECAWRHKKTGKVVDTPKADSWRLENGKAVEFFEYYDTAQVMAAVA